MRILFLITCFISIASCTDEPIVCTENIACTRQFEILTVKISDHLGEPIPLDNYFTLDLPNGNIYDFQNQDDYLDSVSKANGNYILLTDGQMNIINKSGTRFTFKGFVNNMEVVSENYLIGHDCCHVVLMEGNTEIILN